MSNCHAHTTSNELHQSSVGNLDVSPQLQTAVNVSIQYERIIDLCLKLEKAPDDPSLQEELESYLLTLIMQGTSMSNQHRVWILGKIKNPDLKILVNASIQCARINDLCLKLEKAPDDSSLQKELKSKLTQDDSRITQYKVSILKAINNPDLEILVDAALQCLCIHELNLMLKKSPDDPLLEQQLEFFVVEFLGYKDIPSWFDDEITPLAKRVLKRLALIFKQYPHITRLRFKCARAPNDLSLKIQLATSFLEFLKDCSISGKDREECALFLGKVIQDYRPTAKQ